MKKPHIHADVIKAWADGAEIEVSAYKKGVKYHDDAWWFDSTNPDWSTECAYRVKLELEPIVLK
jgi:hypothetical protein